MQQKRTKITKLRQIIDWKARLSEAFTKLNIANSEITLVIFKILLV